ncbi:MAG: hypothetical protein SFV51_05740 [Bryobacteraceae bacterium]|nr:hypothetical protein [Bryobacteraceae bacterium]
MRYVRLTTGSLWLLGQLGRPNLGFMSSWNSETFGYNVGTCVVYTLIGVLLWTGWRVRSV